MTGPFSKSPLFAQASRAIQAEARRAFDQSDFGRLIRQVRQVIGPGTDPLRGQRQVGDMLRNHVNFTPERAARQLLGADFGTLVRRDPAIFPAGRRPAHSRPISGISRAGGGHDQGHRGRSGRRPAAWAGPRAAGHVGRQPVAVLRFRDPARRPEPLSDLGRCQPQRIGGMSVSGVAGIPRRVGGGAGADPQAGCVHAAATRAEHVPRDLPFGTTTRRFLASHPIVTGKMVRATGSSNVWAFGYVFSEGALYVRFAKKGEGGTPSGPGPLYRYAGVTPDQFLSLLTAGSKGTWIWDNLRIRGTTSGQQKDYELLEIMPAPAYGEGYVPRKETVEPVVRHYGRARPAHSVGHYDRRARGPLGPGGPRGGRDRNSKTPWAVDLNSKHGTHEHQRSQQRARRRHRPGERLKSVHLRPFARPGVNIPGMPPNMGEMAVPQVVTFQIDRRVRGARASVWDEAMKATMDNAAVHDQRSGRFRVHRTAAAELPPAQLAPGGRQSPRHRAAGTLGKPHQDHREHPLLRQVPGEFAGGDLAGQVGGAVALRLRHDLRGQAGASRFSSFVIPEWLPIHGDKIVFRYDDGSKRWDPHQVGIRVGAGYGLGDTFRQKALGLDQNGRRRHPQDRDHRLRAGLLPGALTSTRIWPSTST